MIIYIRSRLFQPYALITFVTYSPIQLYTARTRSEAQAVRRPLVHLVRRDPVPDIAPWDKITEAWMS